MDFLGRKAVVLLTLVVTLLCAYPMSNEAKFSTFCTTITALYMAFAGAHSAQQVLRRPKIPLPEPTEDQELG